MCWAAISASSAETRTRSRRSSAFKDLLAKHGVDLLFVPVPTKAEIFPERAATAPGATRAVRAFRRRGGEPLRAEAARRPRRRAASRPSTCCPRSSPSGPATARRTSRAAGAALPGGGHPLDRPRSGARGADRRRTRAALSLVSAARRAPPQLSNEGRLLLAPRRSSLAPARSGPGALPARDPGRPPGRAPRTAPCTTTIRRARLSSSATASQASTS